MAATKQDIIGWLQRAKPTDTHMIVVCDTYDYEDYPVYVGSDENVEDMVNKCNTLNMQKVMEVYNLKQDLQSQIHSVRAWNI